MFYFIYRIPMSLVPWVIVVAVVFWAVIMRVKLIKTVKATKIVNGVLLVVSVLGIIYITLMRKGTYVREIYLMPFHIFSEAAGETDFYRSMLMNAFLFVPFGIFTPFSLPDKLKTNRKILITVSSAMLLSVIVEALQYFFCLGRCETDDVLCNAVGAVIGSLSYILFKIKDKK